MDDSQISQDLFDQPDRLHESGNVSDGQEEQTHGAVDLQMIYKELQSLRKDVKDLKEEVRGNGKTKFSIEVSQTKARFQKFLRNKFSKRPFISTEDLQLKNEIQNCLKLEGYGDDAYAVKTMLSYAAQQFTEFRSKLKTKKFKSLQEIASEHAQQGHVMLAGFRLRNLRLKFRLKQVIKVFKECREYEALSLPSLCDRILKSYCIAEDCSSKERQNTALILRRVVHREDLATSQFWKEFKKILDEAESDITVWKRLQDSDARRCARARARLNEL